MRGELLANPEDVTLPHPSLLGIADPVAASRTKRVPQTVAVPTKRIAWHPIPAAAAPPAVRSPEPIDLKMVPASDPDQPGSTASSSTAKPRWRTVKAAPADQTSATRGQ